MFKHDICLPIGDCDDDIGDFFSTLGWVIYLSIPAFEGMVIQFENGEHLMFYVKDIIYSYWKNTAVITLVKYRGSCSPYKKGV
jgi:hypothetical protein